MTKQLINYGYLVITMLFSVNLYSAAAPDVVVGSHEDRKVSVSDRIAFKHILSIHATVKKCQQDINPHDVDFYGHDDNPALILNTDFIINHRPNCNGITKTGLYVTDDAQHLGSPFGLIRLYQFSNFVDDRLDAFNLQVWSKLKTLEVDDAAWRKSYDNDYFRHDFRCRFLRQIDDARIPLTFIPRSGKDQLLPDGTIDLARRKWFALTAAHSRDSAVVAKWAAASKVSMTKLTEYNAKEYEHERREFSYRLIGHGFGGIG